jgi:ATP-dependent DNA helicase RecG
VTLRPHDLDPLFAELTSLRGVGEALGKLMTRAVGGRRIIDLLYHLPESYIDRRERTDISHALPSQVVTLEAEVVRVTPPETSRQPTKVTVTDGSGFATLVYFRAFPRNRFIPGARLLIAGRIDEQRQIVHPDHIAPAGAPETFPGVEQVWPLTAGLFAWHLRKPVKDALSRIPALPEWQDAALMAREGWPGFTDALAALQTPTSLPSPIPRRRLAYDELLAGQVALGLARMRVRVRPGRPLVGDGQLRAAALHAFGHELTPDQRHVLSEIDADLAGPNRMLRLLQGDVGSGKTLVAVLAMLRAVEAGFQAAIMAPTELLARQHARTLARIAPVPSALLAASVTGKERTRVLEGLASGAIPLAIGTHALVQDAVAFADLALAVIDEQHRFGVDQRLQLGAKGDSTDVLVMTATPIPRTVLLTQWGEMTVSRLAGKPAGRRPIRTTTHPLSKLGEVCDAVARKLSEGARVYWVCPMVSESEALDLAAVEDRFASLLPRFGTAMGMAHGRMDSAVREQALADFSAGRTRLLVATTVIEVGVDVPEATVIVIEHAERFGLAQLHQLRGRVGRGTADSFCLLLFDDSLPQTAERRLRLLRETEDGFRIADEDFRLRGGGDLIGTRQSGTAGWRITDPETDEGLLHMAHRDAQALLERDPELASERGLAVRLLLRLFDRADATRTLHSG